MDDLTIYPAVGEAVDISSTTASNPQTTRKPGGFDWLEVTLWGDYHPTLAISLDNTLAPAQDAAKQNDAVGSITEVAGRSVQVLPRTKPGYKGHYNYIINCEGIQYRLNLKPDRVENSSAASVQIGSETLTRYGAKQCWQQALNFLNQAALFELHTTRVHRVDLCVDIPNQSPTELIKKLQDPKKFICRARQWAAYGDDGPKPTSYRMGKDLQIRVYDKAKELRDKPNESKHALIMQERWNGKDCNKATRIEYQIKREQLAERKIDTITDLFINLPNLITYLTRDWSRLATNYDGKNKDRATTDKEWLVIRGLFQQWAGISDDSLDKRNKPIPDVTRLTTQAIGCLETAIARSGKKPTTSEEAEAYAIELIRGTFGNSIEKILAKGKEYEAKGMLEPGPQPYEEFMDYTA